MDYYYFLKQHQGSVSSSYIYPLIYYTEKCLKSVISWCLQFTLIHHIALLNHYHLYYTLPNVTFQIALTQTSNHWCLGFHNVPDILTFEQALILSLFLVFQRHMSKKDKNTLVTCKRKKRRCARPLLSVWRKKRVNLRKQRKRYFKIIWTYLQAGAYTLMTRLNCQLQTSLLIFRKLLNQIKTWLNIFLSTCSYQESARMFKRCWILHK